MTDRIRRIRMISFRLSESEYCTLKQQYRLHGARNISDLTRLALQRLIQTTNAPEVNEVNLVAKLADFDARFQFLESLITRFLECQKTAV